VSHAARGSKPDIVSLRAFLDVLANLPDDAYPDFAQAVIHDVDVLSASERGDATAMANAISGIAYKVYGFDPPPRVALSLRNFGIKGRR